MMEHRFKEAQSKTWEYFLRITDPPKTREHWRWDTFDRAVEQIRQMAEQLDTCPYTDDNPPPVCFACPLGSKWTKEACKGFGDK